MTEFRTGFGFQVWKDPLGVLQGMALRIEGQLVYRVGQLQSGAGLGWVDGLQWGLELESGWHQGCNGDRGRTPAEWGLRGLPREAGPCSPRSFEGRCLQVIIYPSSRVLLHGYLSVFSALEGTQVSKGVERQETPWDSCLGSLASTNLLSPFFPQLQSIPVPRPAGPAPNPPPIGE